MSAPTDCRGADQFQPAHRDGYGNHLASALDRARKGYNLSAAEASALAGEVERLRRKLTDTKPLIDAAITFIDGEEHDPWGYEEDDRYKALECEVRYEQDRRAALEAE